MFVPAVGYRIVLLAPWSFKLYYEHRNATMFDRVVDGGWKKLAADLNYVYHVDNDYSKGLKSIDVDLPTGTLLEIDRVYVRTANKSSASKEDDYDSITFKVITHPTWKDPKKSKKTRFWVKLEDANNIEYELPPDFAATKEACREKAKLPKKLTAEKILDQLRWSVTRDQDVTTPAKRENVRSEFPWLTEEAYEQMRLILGEYHSIMTPWEDACQKKHDLARYAEIEAQLKAGLLHLPMSVAATVKTMDDLKKSGCMSYVFGERENVGAQRRAQALKSLDMWTLIGIVSGYGQGTTVSTKKNVDGSTTRTFRNDVRVEYANSAWADGMLPESTNHIWLRVTTNADNTEIAKVEAGLDEKAAQ